MNPGFAATLEAHLRVARDLVSCQDAIERAWEVIAATLARGGKLLLCGNGGSAADCQHIAAEFIVRYQRRQRPALPAIALTTDTSILTAHSNDYGFETVFARQVEALGQPGDCLIAISTSGQSPNVIAAVRQARAQGLAVIALTGAGGGELAGLVDTPVIVPDADTARIQEAHILIAHWWCQNAESP